MSFKDAVGIPFHDYTDGVLALDDYQQLALRTTKLLDHQAALEHAAMGLTSDAGELVSCVKAAEVYCKPLGELADPTSLRAHLREECGDVLWFAAYAADLHGAKLSEVATRYIIPRRDLTDTVVHRALHVVGCAANFARCAAFPEYAHHEHALNHLALTLEYLELVMDCYGLNVQDVMQHNATKLRLRYPDRYTDAAAQARADKPHPYAKPKVGSRCTVCGRVASDALHQVTTA